MSHVPHYWFYSNILVRQDINRLHQQHKHKFEDKAISKFLIVCQDFGRKTLKGHGHNPTQHNPT